MTDNIEAIELANRPEWASEGEWDDDVIVYKRDMPQGMVRIDQTLKRGPDGWSFLEPASAYLPGDSGGADYDLKSAQMLAEDLSEAIVVLEGAES